MKNVRRQFDKDCEGNERIVSTPGICGGDARIRFTRIPVWLVVKARRNGATDAMLLADYPFLSPLDLADVWLYYGNHIAEINQQILENEGPLQTSESG